jgi:hypothetical protein
MADPVLEASHQAYARSLLDKELSKYSPVSTPDPDPLLANALAATNAQNKTIADMPVSSNTQGITRALNPMPGDATPVQTFAQEAAAQHQNEAQKAAQAALDAQTPEGQAKTMADAASVGPTAPGQQAPGSPRMPQNLIASAADAGITAAQNRDLGLAYANHDAKAAQQLAQNTAEVEKQENAARKPYEDDLAKQSDESFMRMQMLQQSVAAQQEKRMAHFQNVQDEMEKMAKSQPKDLMGQAGVNKMLGSIAIFLGGAGTNGQHENRNLQMIEQMADRNVQAQKTRFEMLQRVGQGDQTLYGMLTQKLQSGFAAEAALRNSYFSSYEAHLKQVGSQFADKRTSLKLQQATAKIDEMKHQTEMGVRHQWLQDGVGVVQLADNQEAKMAEALAAQHAAAIQDAKFGHELQKDQEAKDKDARDHGFRDVIGTVDGSEHAKLAESWGGAVRIVEDLNKAAELLKADPTASNARTWNALKAINLGAAKKYFATGQRLEGTEVAMMNGVGLSFPQFMEAMALGGKGMTPTEIEQGYRNIQALVAQDAFTTLQAGAPHLQWAPRNTLMGQFNPAVYKFDFAGQSLKNHGPSAKRGLAKSLPKLSTDAITALEQTD